MKTLLFSFVLVFTGLVVSGQDTVYLDTRNQIVKKRKQAELFQVVVKTDTGYVMTILGKSLDLKHRSVYRDSELRILQGYFADYAGKALFAEGNYLNGKKEGAWNYYHNGKRTAAVVYEQDRIISENYYKANGEAETDRSKIEQLPSFVGGPNAMGQYLVRTLKYPPAARERNVTGVVLLEFTVHADGQVADVDVINRVSNELDSEAVRVVRQMPRWNPGVQFGRPVKVRYRMPVTFRLNQ